MASMIRWIPLLILAVVVDNILSSNNIRTGATKYRGTYTDPLIIDKPINIIGNGKTSTFLTGGIQISNYTPSGNIGLLISDMSIQGDVSGGQNSVIDTSEAGAGIEIKNMSVKNNVIDGESTGKYACWL